MARVGGSIGGEHALPRHVIDHVGALKARGMNLVEVTLTIAAFTFLRRIGAIASTPLWMYFALLMGGGVISALAFRTWGADATGRHLHFRVAVNVAMTTAVIYATGWKTTLPLGYMFIATTNSND